MTPVGYQQFWYGVGFRYSGGKDFGKMFTDMSCGSSSLENSSFRMAITHLYPRHQRCGSIRMLHVIDVLFSLLTELCLWLQECQGHTHPSHRCNLFRNQEVEEFGRVSNWDAFAWKDM